MMRLIQSAAIAALLIGSIGPIRARGQAASPQDPAPTSAPPTTAPTARWLFGTDGSFDPAGQRNGWVELAVNPTPAVPPKPVTYLGVSLEPPGEPLRAQLQLQDNVGLLVTWVDEQGPARDVLAKHDVIIRLDDQIVINSEQFEALVHMHKPGDALDIRLVRSAKPIQVSVKLSEKNVAAAFTNWTGVLVNKSGVNQFPYPLRDAKGWITAGDGAAPILIFANPNGQSTTAPATQPGNAAPIDAWIGAKLQDVKPDAPPDRATIARRLYLDVTGTPPSVAQIKAFVNDKSPDAYEKLVQELLKNRPVVIQPQEVKPK